MNAKTELDVLSDFFDRYGSALTAGDVAAIAGCYALPGSVVADAYTFTFSSPASVALSFIGAAPDYQDRELIAAHAKIEHVDKLTPALALVTVEWEFLDSQGRSVPGERYVYLVRTTEDVPAICTVIHAA
ncbi:hypothetical protein [Asanoa siamensis]|uniref:SnoaL-like domain-containing protein n=1 Tax=Asanoa siamensis TaxID=926357 RepID=A0ABQ4D435_9ACTN|nr:hypothetical protein [Asanoa siamensis]GIF78304.1 hypothetical protein Asi02nite_78220 [Asanoa siamensis]